MSRSREARRNPASESPAEAWASLTPYRRQVLLDVADEDAEEGYWVTGAEQRAARAMPHLVTVRRDNKWTYAGRRGRARACVVATLTPFGRAVSAHGKTSQRAGSPIATNHD